MNDIIKKLIIPNNGTKYLFIAGKGGVGKTSIACMTAVWLAKKGYKTLLVTTDPATHLANVLEQEVNYEPTEVNGIPNLWTANIEQKKAHEEYKKRILDIARKKYSEDVIKTIEEELNSPCAEEMAAFEKFVDFILEPDYDVIIFDTAPTGHTIRFLQLPTDWSRQIELSGLVSGRTGSVENVKEKFKKVIEIMSNQNRTTFAFVLYPEEIPMLEAWKASEELKTIGIKTNLVIANMILSEEHCRNGFFKKRKQMQEQYLREIEKRFNAQIIEMPLLSSEIVGTEMLVKAGEMLYGV